jgi:hypothetical protein
MIAGNLFSVAFGRNLDAHEPGAAQANIAPAPSRQCLDGRQCYVDTLHITIAACFLAMVLSVWAAWRDRRKIAAAERTVWRPDVVWEDTED